MDAYYVREDRTAVLAAIKAQLLFTEGLISDAKFVK